MENIKVRPRTVLDTNVLISGLIYGGIPAKLLFHILDHEITGISSSALIVELEEVLRLKFPDAGKEIHALQHRLRLNLVMVHTHKRLRIVKDDADNRILEAAVAGKAQYIVTGDKELLALKKFRSIKIVTPRQFLELLG